MTKIVLSDPAVIAVLNAIRQRTELCDSDGRVLGVYVPDSGGATKCYKGAKSPYSEEELERRFREEAKDARPLADFWAEMQAKHPDQFQ